MLLAASTAYVASCTLGVSVCAAQTATGARPAGAAQAASPSDPGTALDFLGSVSAPQAVLATETGHTSARPPSATTDRRLAELASDLGELPADPPALRNWLARTLATPSHPPEDWFRLGTAALQAARADSRRLAELAPSSDWNRQLEAHALASRYPTLAKIVWDGRSGGTGPAQSPADIEGTGAARSSRPVQGLADADHELAQLDQAPESPQVLYTRTRLLLDVSEQAYLNAAASPQLDARLYALQALAAEDENDEGGALKEYRAGLEKHPESALLHAGLGHLDRVRNNDEQARSQLEQAWRLDPTDPLVAFELGDVDLRMGEPAHALTLLNQALELDPNLLVARWARGRAYMAAGGEGSEKRALDDLKAAESCDRSGTLEHQIAQLYSRLGQTEEAQEAERRSQEQRRIAADAKHPATAHP
jgi:Tfp pilus assembly protein PilF